MSTDTVIGSLMLVVSAFFAGAMIAMPFCVAARIRAAADMKRVNGAYHGELRRLMRAA